MLRFFIELLIGVERVNVPSLSDGYDVRVLRKRLVRDGTVVLSLLIFEKVEFYEVGLLHRGTCHGISVVLPQVRHDVK